MQDYAKSHRLSLNTILFFALLLFIAFLPVSSFLFFIKNDAFTGYFPPKFFMSESIHAGHLPLWNPYINYGFPQYGDMSGGYWNPITWLIASTVGYNAYTFTIETLLYIFIGGIGVYKLCSYWQLSKTVAVIAGISFMCCGYNVGHLQHFNWLSGTAFLPWCVWAYIKMINTFSLKNILTAILVFYILISSAHPGIVIACFYFFLLLIIFMIIKKQEGFISKLQWKKTGFSHLFFIVGLLLLAAGLIAGYSDIIPYFLRGEKISLQDSLLNNTSLPSWMSVLFPLSTVKNDALFNTDISMRNCYFGLTILLFFLLACFRKKNKWQLFFLFTGFIFALLSSGGIFKTIAYKCIPFLGYVRLNGEFRIFSLLCFIMMGAIELDKYLKAKEVFEGRIKWIVTSLQIFTLAAIATGLLNIILYKNSVLFSPGDSIGLIAKLKFFLDHLTFYDTLWMQGMVQFIILLSIRSALKLQRWKWLKLIVALDLMIVCLLNIPFTGAGKASVKQLQSVIDQSPKGIPIPLLKGSGNTDTLGTEEKDMLGDWSMYNKQIGTRAEVAYPIILKNMRQYFDSLESGKKYIYLEKPFVFLRKQNENNRFTITNFSGSSISVSVEADSANTLIFQQNWYPHWKYNVDSPVMKEGMNFMSVPVQKGKHEIKIAFDPSKIRYAMLLSLVIFCVLITLLIFLKPTRSSLS